MTGACCRRAGTLFDPGWRHGGWASNSTEWRTRPPVDKI